MEEKTERGRHALIVTGGYCDADALLFECRPDGPTCHTGSESCFFNDIDLGGNENG